jgi:AraC-like DNA-binding protein
MSETSDCRVVRRDQHMAGASTYREFRPSPELARYLVCLWTQTTHSQTEFAQRVLPDGCVDVVLMNGVAIVVGPWTKPFVANLPPGTNIFGARIHPGLASSLLGISASELLNRSLPLCDVWGSANSSEFGRIADQTTLQARMSAMETLLLMRGATARPADKAIMAAIQWIARHPYGRVEQLSQWLGVSRRQIQRRFTIAVGYGPKLFQSVFRFQRLLHLASNEGMQGNLARFAVDADYADQAHMTREVKRFSGKRPSKLLQSSRSTLALSGLMRP